MACYERREVVTKRVEYLVKAPARGSGGIAYWHGLHDAMLAIQNELGAKAAYDDAVQIEARDDEIVLSFEVET